MYFLKAALSMFILSFLKDNNLNQETALMKTYTYVFKCKLHDWKLILQKHIFV